MIGRATAPKESYICWLYERWSQQTSRCTPSGHFLHQQNTIPPKDLCITNRIPSDLAFKRFCSLQREYRIYQCNYPPKDMKT
jgi:hypothetical protein